MFLKFKKWNKWFTLSLVVPIFILMGMITQPMMTIVFGETIILKTLPLDPRDRWRGDYVSLKYEIQQIPFIFFDPDIFKIKEPFKDEYTSIRIPVYVELKKSNSFYSVKKVTRVKPSSNIYLKGDIYYSPYSNNEFIQVRYEDINTFYVEEKTGGELEEKARKGDLLVSMKISNGKGILTSIDSK
jgi:uncharacterized membrane-anchored protein